MYIAGWRNDRRVIFRFPSEERGLSFLEKRANWLVGLPRLGIKRSGPEAEVLVPSNFEVNEVCCAISALFIHTVHGRDFT